MVGVKIGLVSVEVEIGLLLLLFSILFAPFHLVVSTLNFRGLSVLSDLDLPHMIPHCLCFHSQFNRSLRGTLLVVSLLWLLNHDLQRNLLLVPGVA